MGNPNHDERGRFTSGASAANAASARGDHLAQQPAAKDLRRVPGHGLIERSAPVAKHNGADSVGTNGNGGPQRFSESARARVIRQKAIDARHYGVPGDMQGRLNKLALGKPQAGLAATPGRFDARSMKLKNYGG